AQTGDPSGARSWQDALGAHVGDRWRLAGLTVNYRTPAEIMSVAAAILAEIDPDARPPRSVRESGSEPWQLAADPASLPEVAAQAAAWLAGQTGDGRLAVITAAGRLDAVAAAVSAALPGTAVSVGDQP